MTALERPADGPPSTGNWVIYELKRAGDFVKDKDGNPRTTRDVEKQLAAHEQYFRTKAYPAAVKEAAKAAENAVSLRRNLDFAFKEQYHLRQQLKHVEEQRNDD